MIIIITPRQNFQKKGEGENFHIIAERQERDKRGFEKKNYRNQLLQLINYIGRIKLAFLNYLLRKNRGERKIKISADWGEKNSKKTNHSETQLNPE